MFTDHGSFIIAFSLAKGHISVSPEPAAISFFEEDIKSSGYSYTQGIFRIKFEEEVNYDLLDRMIIYNIEEKKDTKSFWR